MSCPIYTYKCQLKVTDYLDFVSKPREAFQDQCTLQDASHLNRRKLCDKSQVRIRRLQVVCKFCMLQKQSSNSSTSHLVCPPGFYVQLMPMGNQTTYRSSSHSAGHKNPGRTLLGHFPRKMVKSNHQTNIRPNIHTCTWHIFLNRMKAKPVVASIFESLLLRCSCCFSLFNSTFRQRETVQIQI